MIYDMAGLKRKLVNFYPFFGSVSAGLEYMESDKIETLSHEGNCILYNPVYMGSLNESEQIFMLAHEICHIAFDHDARGAGRNKVIWDQATDAVINQLLKKDGLELPVRAVDYPEASEYDAEDYYDFLMEKKMAIDLMFGQMEGQESPAGAGSGGELSMGDSTDSGSDEQNDEFSAQEPQMLTEDEDESDEDIFR